MCNEILYYFRWEEANIYYIDWWRDKFPFTITCGDKPAELSLVSLWCIFLNWIRDEFFTKNFTGFVSFRSSECLRSITHRISIAQHETNFEYFAKTLRCTHWCSVQNFTWPWTVYTHLWCNAPTDAKSSWRTCTKSGPWLFTRIQVKNQQNYFVNGFSESQSVDWSKKKFKSFVHRRKTQFDLIRVSFIVVGLEFAYAAETAFTAPTLLEIGIEHKVCTHNISIFCLKIRMQFSWMQFIL